MADICELVQTILKHGPGVSVPRICMILSRVTDTRRFMRDVSAGNYPQARVFLGEELTAYAGSLLSRRLRHGSACQALSTSARCEVVNDGPLVLRELRFG